MNDDRLPEYFPTMTLERDLAEHRREYDAKHGKGAWQRLVDADWAEAERIEAERRA